VRHSETIKHQKLGLSANQLFFNTLVFLVLLSLPTLFAQTDAAFIGPIQNPTLFPVEKAWTHKLSAAPATFPGHDNDRVYISLDDSTHAINLSDGKLLWSLPWPSSHQPVSDGANVFLATTRALLAISTSSGSTTWKLEFSSDISAPPLQRGGWVIVATANNELFALRSSDGRIVWRQSTGATVTVQPTLAGTSLYIPTSNATLLALDIQTGEELWTSQLAGNPQKPLALDSIFVGADDNFFYRLSLSSGRVEWRWRTGGDIVGQPAVDEENVYFVSLDNMLWALDRQSGVQQWRRPLNLRPRASPLIFEEYVFVTGVTTILRSYHNTTGQGANRMRLDGELAAPPMLPTSSENHSVKMAILLTDGTLLGFHAAKGPMMFLFEFPPDPFLPRPELIAVDELYGLAPFERINPVPVSSDIFPFDPI